MDKNLGLDKQNSNLQKISKFVKLKFVLIPETVRDREKQTKIWL